MSSEKFCLRWNDFESNISVAFRELRDDKDFFDVTLACDDEQMQAHKVILSACSPFFRNILRRNPHQHPLLYLRGVKYSDLQSVLNFMYHGEVNVAQEELNSFLAVAEDLKVKGLTQNGNKSGSGQVQAPVPKKSYPETKPQVQQNTFSRDLQVERDHINHQQQIKRSRPPPPPLSSVGLNSQNRQGDDDIQEVVPVKSEPRDPVSIPPAPISVPQAEAYSEQTIQHQSEEHAMEAYTEEESYDDYGQYDDNYANAPLDDQTDDGNRDHSVGSLEATVCSYLVNQGTGGAGWQCIECGRTGKKGDMKRHVEARHLLNTQVACKYCGKLCKTTNSLQHHIATCTSRTPYQ